MALSLTVSDLKVTATGRRLLLDVPTLTVAPGEQLGVSGPSGAGKSTLLLALSGLLTARGSVCWGETDLLLLDDDARSRFRAARMGMIFQDFLLFDELSALDNAALPALYAPQAEHHAIRRRAEHLLGLLGLDDDPRPVASFSGGERQRVAVARALAADPEVILADEPTAALDRRTADKLIADLTTLARATQKTLIVVSHDANLLDATDRVMTLGDGRLSEAAT